MVICNTMEKLIIQSDINNIIEVERFVYSVCDTFNINNYAAVIVMSLIQAVENAIVHGNGNDPSKIVTINFDYCRGGVCFSVSDQGQGFDYNSMLASMTDTPQGKGLFLMNTLSDNLSFSENGSTVRLEFVIGGIEASRALERVATLNKYYSRTLVTV